MDQARDMQAKVLWVTNLAPPYRLPVWRALGTMCQLRIGLLESSERLARDKGSNRGPDWQPQQVPGAKIVEYRTARVKRGEDRHYGLVLPDAARDLARADAVLLGGWDSPAYWQLLAQARATGKPTVGFHESTLASASFSEGPIARARAQFFRSLHRVVVPGVAAGDAIRAMGVEPHRVVTGFNAVDTERFSSVAAAEPHQGHRYLYVGQLIERKNLETVLRSFAAIAHGDDRLTLVGRGDHRDALVGQAWQLAVTDQVDFVDYVPNAELPALMARHDTLVLASDVEVWGLVVNEALATGMHVVVTANCGVAPSVQGMPGVHLAAEDASDLAATMATARDSFSGRIQSPPILQHTPRAFAAVFSRAFDEAIADHRARKHR